MLVSRYSLPSTEPTTLYNKMRAFFVFLLALAVLAQAEKPKDKRTTVDPNTGYPQYSQQQYQQAASAYSQAAAREQQPEYTQQQQYYQPEAPQAQAISYQPVSKYSAAPVQKYAYQPQPKQQIPYSSAADVSSFSYSSPIVSYNNLGLLQQLAGKGGSAQDVPVTYNTAQSSKVEYQPQPKLQYVSSPKVQYTSSPVQYTSSPKIQYTSAAKSQHAQQYTNNPITVSAYSATNAAPNYEEIYQQIAQKAAYTAPEPQAQHQPQAAASYQPAAQKYVYAQNPSQLVYQIPKGAGQQQEAYSASPSQQYTYQLPQEYEKYEAQSQSAPQVYYSQQGSGASAQTPQYYTLGSHSQSSKANVQYA